MKVRTRFAPSPTGHLHLGNVRTAVFNWLFARHHHGAFVLRVEDTDTERNVAGAEEAIMEDLRWLGLEWDEGPDIGGSYGPYRQSEREGIYREHLQRLLDSGRAYPCFCSQEEARGADRRYPGTCRDLDRDEVARRLRDGVPHVVRVRAPREGAVRIVDVVRGPIDFPAQDMDDFVLRRQDGRVTYNFAVVVDDVTMEITHVIRGAGHLSNTPKQALVFDAFGTTRPVFVHLPNVLAPDGGKLSKRHGAPGVAELRERGMLSEAVVNYLSLLGWSHPDEKEILSRSELVESVDLDRIRPTEMAYDPDKLEWVAAQHFAALPLDRLVEEAEARVDRGRFPLPDGGLTAAVSALRSRMAAHGDLDRHLTLVYPQDADAWEAEREQVRSDPEAVGVVTEALKELRTLNEWTRPELKKAFARVGSTRGVRGPGLYHPLRQALFGAVSGPDLGGLAEAVGREESIRRLERVVPPSG